MNVNTTYTSAKAQFQISTRIGLIAGLVRNKAERDDHADFDAADEEWDAALRDQFDAWTAMANAPVSSLAELGDKIRTCRAEPSLGTNDNCLAILAAAVEHDVTKLEHAAAQNDAEIQAAFARWQAAHAERSALPDGQDIDEREAPFWKIIGDAEEEIRTAIANTPAGVACKLWVSLEHDMALQADHRWARAADLAAIKDDGDRDWSVRLVLSAIRSLKAMEA